MVRVHNDTDIIPRAPYDHVSRCIIMMDGSMRCEDNAAVGSP